MAGVFDGISARTIAELQKHVPCLPINDFTDAIAIYRVERARVAATPKEARDQLDTLAGDAMRLSAAIAKVTGADGVRGHFGQECAAIGEPMFAVRLCDDLRRLAGLAEAARRSAEKQATVGSSLSSRTKLIHRLAWALERVGETPDYRASGPLVLAFDIAMQEVGETVADPKSTVRSALGSRPGKQ